MTKSNFFPLSFGKYFNYIIQEFWWGALQGDQSSQFACNFPDLALKIPRKPLFCANRDGWSLRALPLQEPFP